MMMMKSLSDVFFKIIKLFKIKNKFEIVRMFFLIINISKWQIAKL